MKKLFIILAFLPLFGFGQELLIPPTGKVLIFQGKILVVDTTPDTEPVRYFTSRTDLTLVDEVDGSNADVGYFPIYESRRGIVIDSSVATTYYQSPSFDIDWSTFEDSATIINWIVELENTNSPYYIQSMYGYLANRYRQFIPYMSWWWSGEFIANVNYPGGFGSAYHAVVTRWDSINLAVNARMYSDYLTYNEANDVVIDGNYGTTETQLTFTQDGDANNVVKILIFNKYLTDSELDSLIRYPWIIPTSLSDVEFSLSLNNGYDLRNSYYDSKQGIEFNQVDLSNRPVQPSYYTWRNRKSDMILADAFLNGYTKRNNTQISYLNETKQSIEVHDTIPNVINKDIEYPVSSVMHNMANSLIDFNPNDSTGYRFDIFDKTNITYWNNTVLSYNDSAYSDTNTHGLYTLWHPDELDRDFIKKHAKLGYKNRIWSKLRIEDSIATGIEEVAVYDEEVESNPTFTQPNKVTCTLFLQMGTSVINGNSTQWNLMSAGDQAAYTPDGYVTSGWRFQNQNIESPDSVYYRWTNFHRDFEKFAPTRVAQEVIMVKNYVDSLGNTEPVFVYHRSHNGTSIINGEQPITWSPSDDSTYYERCVFDLRYSISLLENYGYNIDTINVNWGSAALTSVVSNDYRDAILDIIDHFEADFPQFYFVWNWSQPNGFDAANIAYRTGAADAAILRSNIYTWDVEDYSLADSYHLDNDGNIQCGKDFATFWNTH